jgi:DNA mismatch repair ATPase MutS
LLWSAEVESVRRLVRSRGDGRQHPFLPDEIFRGTNTPERIAGAYAVLAHLDQDHDIVVVATHDIERMNTLGASYAPHHFREHIENGTLTFDYLMRDGSATTRNAIARLELMEYPPELVESARQALSRRPS